MRPIGKGGARRPLFYIFAALLIASAAMVIFARNPVHSVLWLIVAFFNAAGLMVLIGAEFIAMLLVIVYVGAVAVLFLFVVMMLNIDFAELRAGFVKNVPLGLMLAVVLVAELVMVGGAWVFGDLAVQARAAPAPGARLSNTEAIGTILYTDYVFIFQMAGMILLTAMVGAIVLTLRQRPGVKRQDVGKQNARTPRSAMIRGRWWVRGCSSGREVTIGIGHYLVVGANLFTLGVLGIFINRKNIIVILMSVELILLAVKLLIFVAFSIFLGDMVGQLSPCSC